MKIAVLLLFVFIFLVPSVCMAQDYGISLDDRNEATLLTNKAIQHIKENKASDAIALLLKAIAVDSIYRDAYVQLYKASTMSSSHTDVVFKSMNKAVKLFYDDDELIYYMGELYLLKQDSSNALIQYTNAINYSKENGEDF